MTLPSTGNLEARGGILFWIADFQFLNGNLNSDHLSYIIISYSSKKGFGAFVYCSYFVQCLFLKKSFH